MNAPVFQAMLARRSIRRYTPEPVGDEQVRRLLDAAMAAPSASNRQPWHFVVVSERETLDALAEAHPYGKMLFEAPLCIVVCAEPENEHWVADCSAATENILVTAVELGLGSVWLGVHPRSERAQAVREVLGIPPRHNILCLISLGHPAEEKEPRTQYREDRVHRERW